MSRSGFRPPVDGGKSRTAASIRLGHGAAGMRFSQLVQHSHHMMQVSLHSPGMRGGTRDQPDAVVLGCHPAVCRGALQFGR